MQSSTPSLLSSSDRAAAWRCAAVVACIAALLGMVSTPASAQTGDRPLTRAAADLAGVQGGASAIGDVDGDGAKDIFVAGDESEVSPSATLYLGDGDGSFTEAGASIEGVLNGPSASIGDVDKDGNLDLLVTGENESFSPSATLYLGNGDGTFEEAEAGLTGVTASSSSIADVNNDGNPDLVITGEDENFSETATVYLGNGDGTFDEAGTGLTGVVYGSTSVADVNGDDNPDILVAGESDSENFVPVTTLYLGNGDGTFSEAEADLLDVRGGTTTSIGDLDGDGNEDLLVAGEENFEPAVAVYLGSGDGTFDEANVDLAGFRGAASAIADADGDGNQDILLAGESKIGFEDAKPDAKLYLGDGTGSFSEQETRLTSVISESDGTTSLSVADVYDDGDPDVVITGRDGFFDEPSARLYVNGTNQTSPNRSPRFARSFSVEGPLAPGLALTKRYVEAGDPDGDALTVEAVQGENASISDAGDGISEFTFAPDRTQGTQTIDIQVDAEDSGGATATLSLAVDVPGSVATFPDSLAGFQRSSTAMGDVDGDGNLDVLIAGNRRLSSTDNPPAATLYLGDGVGGFEEAEADLTRTEDGSVSVVDVNGDGNDDLLITGEDADGNASTTLYLSNGDGTVSPADAGLEDLEESSVAAADFNGDGNTDFYIGGKDSNFEDFNEVYLGNGDGTFEAVGVNFSFGIFGDFRATAVGDANGDGNPDLFVSRTTSLLLGNGDGTFDTSDWSRVSSTSEGSASMADINGDGNQDLLVTGGDSDDVPVARLYLGVEDGAFEEQPAGAGLTGVRFSSTSVADVDSDGNRDFLVTGVNESDEATATVYLGNGDATFDRAEVGMAGVGDAPDLFNDREGSSTSIGDVDGDGDPDMLVTGTTPTTRSASSIVYENLFDNPIPVELAGFEGAATDGGARLTWQTASETGNAGFEVQRRAAGENGEEWTKVGFVSSKAPGGTTERPRSYRFVDTGLPYDADRLTYRLKQVDTDGTATLTDPVTIERGVSEVELLGTFPNPAQSRATVRYALPAQQDAQIRLYDALGRQVRMIVNGQEEGRHEETIDVSELPSGTYFLQLQADGQTETKQLTVTR